MADRSNKRISCERRTEAKSAIISRSVGNISISAINLVFVTLMLTACSAVVKIGSQTWTTENLSVATFRNGSAIPYAKTVEDWIKAAEDGKPAWCYYNNDVANGKKYGKLYNWYAVTDTRGLAPNGWHVPDEKEWKILADNLGGYDVAGGKLKATTDWISPNIGADNSSRFAGLPGGLRDYDGTFSGQGSICSWWTVTEGDTTRAWDCFLLYSGGRMNFTIDAKALGLSVRCLKNN